MADQKSEGIWDKALRRGREAIHLLQQGLRKRDVEIEQLRKENDLLRKEVEKLKEELKLLRQVPEWVKPNKPEPESVKRQKKRGPKKGHVAHLRQRPQEIDTEVKIIPKICPHCDSDLPEPDQWHEHVQVDLPPPQKPIVTKYRVGWCYCAHCQKRVSVQEKLSHSQYGPVLHAMVAYWKFSLGLTLGKIQQLLSHQYQLDLSSGVLSGMLQRVARRLEGSYDDLATQLRSQRYLHIDESGWRNDGVNHWLWSFSNRDLSYYVIHKSRGQKVLEETLGKSFHGIACSDFYGAYNILDGPKQKCWVHILRDLRELRKKYPHSREIKVYARRMKRFFKRGVALQELYRQGKNIESRYQRLLADTETWSFKKQKHPKLRTLSKRLIKYRHELYTFIKNGIEPTNNNAEREIRPAVLMRKISYGNRSDQGMNTQAILMSMIRTSHKQGKNFPQATADLLRRPLQ